ncbi:hypothetical protein, partial [Pseudomonas sp. BAV 2493]|uniref:hypothetical protein n=2 Tax=unclassified Pseudomonas TaxID=196821 RepID=UPI001C49B209
WGMLLTTSAAYILRMFRAVSVVKTPEMKKPSEEGFGRAVHQCERISLNALCLTLGQSNQTGVPTQTTSSTDNMVIPKAV